MNNMPSELLSLFGSSLFGSLMRVWSFSTIARHRERLLALHRRGANPAVGPDTPRSSKYFGASWTRRLIALTAVFFVIAFPKLLAVWKPDLLISIGYPQMEDGFLFFSSAGEKIRWVQLKGLVITPLDTHLLSAIVGLYFGSSLVEHV
jgi:hypothetical protein